MDSDLEEGETLAKKKQSLVYGKELYMWRVRGREGEREGRGGGGEGRGEGREGPIYVV